jgi:hypothetical protein
MPRKHTCKNKRNSSRKGGNKDDIEMGPPVVQVPMGPVPPDPQRFQEYEKREIQRSLNRPSTPVEANMTFSKPNPEAQQGVERALMFNEDPLNQDPFEAEQLTIFGSNDKGGTRKRHYKKRNNKRKTISRRRYYKRR